MSSALRSRGGFGDDPDAIRQHAGCFSEELFIERDINWIRLRDITLRYVLPGRYLKGKDLSAFLTGTDLLLITNYSGLDPIVNGNSAAVGGSGGAGIDFGNFPMPRRFTLGFTVRY